MKLPGILHPAAPDITIDQYIYHWGWRADVIIVLGLMTLLYVVGWWRLRRRGSSLATGWRLTSYLAGITALVLALLSPIDTMQEILFIMHMVQHELLMMIAPPLLFLAAPFPIALWGMPAGPRRMLRHVFSSPSQGRSLLKTITSPQVSLMIFLITLWGWHDPNAYNGALRIAWLHDAEHLTFFGSSMLFWWHVTGAAPHIHGRMKLSARVLYVLLVFFLNLGPSVAITLADKPIYTFYVDAPRPFDITVMDDQRIGGLIMWIFGGMMYAATALILIARSSVTEKKSPAPGSAARQASGVHTQPTARHGA